jgi:uncharacterized LabA/DUF88 family protein
MSLAMAFMDGGYIDAILSGEKILYERLAAEMAAPHELFRAQYYHCLPPNRMAQEESAFFSALGQIPKFDVRLGKLGYRHQIKDSQHRDGRKYHQKRVDVMMAVDMVEAAASGKISHIALFCCDSDLIPAVEAVKRYHVSVTLWHGGPEAKASKDLWRIVDQRREFTKELIHSMLWTRWPTEMEMPAVKA